METQDSLNYSDDFSKQKIIWAELARTGNAFTYDTSGSILLNTCYILTIPGSDIQKLKFILGVLNSKLILFYMNIISSKLDETGWRWLKQFVQRLPIPLFNESNLDICENVDLLLRADPDKNRTGKDNQGTLNYSIYRLYNLSKKEISFIETQ